MLADIPAHGNLRRLATAIGRKTFLCYLVLYKVYLQKSNALWSFLQKNDNTPHHLSYYCQFKQDTRDSKHNGFLKIVLLFKDRKNSPDHTKSGLFLFLSHIAIFFLLRSCFDTDITGSIHNGLAFFAANPF